MKVYVALIAAGPDTEIVGVFADPIRAKIRANTKATDHYKDAVGVVQVWEIEE